MKLALSRQECQTTTVPFVLFLEELRTQVRHKEIITLDIANAKAPT